MLERGAVQAVVPDTAGAVLRRAPAPAPDADTTAPGLRIPTRTVAAHCNPLRTWMGSSRSPELQEPGRTCLSICYKVSLLALR